jgi:hypothetical protein
MILSWFDTAKVDALVDAAVADLSQRAPAERLAGEPAAAKKARTQVEKWHDAVLRKAHDFVREQRPNFYQKARLANRMKWALREAGYPSAFVDEFAYALASVVATAASDRTV